MSSSGSEPWRLASSAALAGTKRSRDDSALNDDETAAYTSAQQRLFRDDDGWATKESDGAFALDTGGMEDDATERLGARLAAKRHAGRGGSSSMARAGEASQASSGASSAAVGGVRGPAAGSAKAAYNATLDDLWQRSRLAAAGLEAGADAFGGHGDSLPDARRRVEIAVNRECRPTFLAPDGGEAQFSRQRDLVLPIRDERSDLAVAARAGSKALVAWKKATAERRLLHDAVDTKDSDLERAVGRSTTAGGAVAPAAGGAPPPNPAVPSQRGSGVPGPPSLRTARGEDATSDAAVLERDPAIEEVRAALPIAASKGDIVRTVRENQVTVIVGETGSGKTTQVVQYLHEAKLGSHGLIACTQPRRLAVIGVATRVAAEMACPVGGTVGYAIRLENRTSDKTRIKFMTDGVLLAELVADPLLSKYSVIVMDEAHERSVNTDVLFGAMLGILKHRSHFHLVVTSATLDVARFSEFFGQAPVVSVPGRYFSVTDEWASSPVADYVEEAVFRCVEIHVTREPGDILVFVTGRDDVEAVAAMIGEKLAERAPLLARTLMVLRSYSELPSAELQLILAPPPPGMRKCVVATNVAETSLTIDGVRYVIDSGFHKTNVFKPQLGMDTLAVYPVSQAQAKQRAGRAGRTSAGTCFRLYTELQYSDEMLPAAVPEILRSSVDSVVLLLKSIGVQDLKAFQFMDPPPEANIRASLYHLWLLAALDEDGAITADGRRMADFPAEPNVARVVLSSPRFGCCDEALTTMAVLAVDAKSVFTAPLGREEAALSAREKFHVPDSDHLTLLNVYRQFRAAGRSRQWADAHFVSHGALERAVAIRAQFEEKLRAALGQRAGAGGASAALSLPSCDGDDKRLRRCLVTGYLMQTAKRRSYTDYTTLLMSVEAVLHPTSALHSAGTAPDYVVYHDFMLTAKQYISVATAVEAEWLIEEGKGLFYRRGGDAGPGSVGGIDTQEVLLQAQARAKMDVASTDAAEAQRQAAPLPSRDAALKQRQAELAKKKRGTFSL